ncbi:hypothetical protein BH10CYA1_BH10CYA1_47380 [soil metagenome]
MTTTSTTTIRRKRFTAEQKHVLMRLFHIMFDYDNTLGMTEAPAFEACCAVVNATLTVKGVAANNLFTPESLMKRFVGYSFRRMITELAAEHGFGFDAGMTEKLEGEDYRPELEILVKKEEMAVIAKLASDIKPTDGVNELLAHIADIEKSVVSSSAERRVRACLKGAGQEGFFETDRIFSAANYQSSKPDPRVYLEALAAMGLIAHNCIAVEDSLTGARAAVGAGITVIGYLGAYPVEEQAHIRKAMRKLGVKVIITDWSQFEAALAKLAVQRFGAVVT